MHLNMHDCIFSSSLLCMDYLENNKILERKTSTSSALSKSRYIYVNLLIKILQMMKMIYF